MSLSTNLSQNEINTVVHGITRKRSRDLESWSIGLLYQENRSERKKSAITLLQAKINLTTSAELTKTILFNRKIFRKNSPKNRMHFDKTSPKKRNSKENPATQRKKQPNCAGKPPNWQHCWSGMQLQW